MTFFRHPYLSVPKPSLRFWSIVVTAAFLVSTSILAIAVPASQIEAVANFVQSESSVAQVILDQWDTSLRSTFGFMLGFDFLYDLVHNNLVALLVAWGAKRTGVAWTLALASVIAWILWLDSVLNVVENLGYLRVMVTGNVLPWHLYGSILFQFRTLTLVAGAVVACSLHVWAFAKLHATKSGSTRR